VGIDAVMWFRLQHEMSDYDITAVNREAVRAFPWTFPFPSISPIERDNWDEWPPGEMSLISDSYFGRTIEKPQGGYWYRVGIWNRYCFIGPSRSWPHGLDTRGAEGAMEHCDLGDWIERMIPSAEVWYGEDCDCNLRRWDAHARRIRRAYLYLSNSMPESFHEALPIMTLARETAPAHPDRARWLLEFHLHRFDGSLADAFRRLAAEICPG
jgi:hypothetical protein